MFGVAHVCAPESFSRFKDPLPYEESGERKLILLTVVLVSNLGADLAGINQILSTYMPQCSAETNDDKPGSGP